MSAFQVIVLAIIQGLTEFLPVSSSGHLVLAPHFLGWDPPGVSFHVSVHLGTLLATVAFFRREIALVFRRALARRAEEKNEANSEGIGRLTLFMILLGTVPAVVVGLVCLRQVEALFERPVWVGGFLIVTAAILTAGEAFSRQRRSTNQMRWTDALLIGFAQGCAIAPGISRSGATICAGLLLGFRRSEAVAFAFLLSLPAILGGTALEMPHLAAFPGTYVLAMAVSAVAGYLAINWVLTAVRRARLRYFAVYCLALGVVAVVSGGA